MEKHDKRRLRVGIEPSLTRFDDFKMRALAPGDKKQYKIKYIFGGL